MNEVSSRLEMLIGEQSLDKLKKSHVAIFGVGGVGGYVLESLVRSFVGEITVVDSDYVAVSNINRQILATTDTIGRRKVEVAKDRVKSINENCVVHTVDMFFLPENSHEIDFSRFDYIVDAIDTVSAKIELAKIAQEKNIPIIACMGTGNKLHPEFLEVSDIFKTSVCPLARAMRSLCKKNGIKKLKVVYSKEESKKAVENESISGKSIPASSAFVPSAAGLIISSVVVNDMIK